MYLGQDAKTASFSYSGETTCLAYENNEKINLIILVKISIFYFATDEKAHSILPKADWPEN